jgi:hypothetical protein
MNKGLLAFLYTILFISIIILIILVSIPFWSDTKKVCEYWEKQNGEMVCIKETIVFCLEKECSNE